MHPDLRPYYDHVIPVFWPWLWWNLVRTALWYQRTGQNALFAVDCFGNIRLVRLADAPAPSDTYTYEAPNVPRWERLALGSDAHAIVRTGPCKSGMVRHDPAWSAMVRSGMALIRSLAGLFPDLSAKVRGPP